METRLEVITPALALLYLERNTKNRSIRKGVVAQYARDMMSGSWRLTHQGIAFAHDGTLLDGQHRLEAIVASGMAIRMMVTRGVAKDAQLNMDDHAKRDAANAINLARDWSVSPVEVSVIRAAVELQRQQASQKLTKAEIMSLCDVFAEPMNFIRDFMKNTTKGVTTAPVWASVSLAWFYVDDIERLDWFCRILSGKETSGEDADRVAHRLRDQMMNCTTLGGPNRIDNFKKTQRAIDAFMKRQNITKIYASTVFYPWPLVKPVRQSLKVEDQTWQVS